MVPTSDRLAQRLGAIFGFFGVLLGAMGAHGPVHNLLVRENHLDSWKTALLFQWLHAVALIAIGQGRPIHRPTVILWLVGVLLFSGSIYLLALDPSQKWAGPITPMGGLILMAGWVWLYLSLFKKPS